VARIEWPVDAPLTAPDALVRPWRRATLVASLVAAVELVLLIGAAVLLLAKPLSHALQRHAEASAYAPAKRAVAALPKSTVAVGLPRLARQETGVFVLNGNGRAGAASREASLLQHLGYVVPGTGNAQRSDYATTFVMFRPGFRSEAQRLAHDLHLRVVGPLNGLSPATLRGGQLAIVLGAA
jgi:hypothetical protein